MKFLSLFILSLIYSFAVSEVYFNEKFSSGWEKRWVKGTREGLGEWAVEDGGLKTKQDAKFYAISSKLEKSFSNEKKDLVIQFTVKHPQGIDCGGGYLKFLPKQSDFTQEDFKGESKYNIMFGPDICGGTKKVHLIFNYDGKNLDWRKSPTAESDTLTHLYTVVVRPDNTYEYFLDGESKEKGTLKEDWEFLKPKEIPDASAKKPEDWVDNPMMLDAEDKKPEDWDKEPKTLPDPNAKKPDGWDDEEDGEWQAPQIANPNYKGEWKQRMIKNPNYKGPWVAPNIPNPDFKDDDLVYKYDDFSYVGIDLWQVKSGSVFNNILITDDVKTAEEERKPILELIKKEKEEEEKRQKAEEEKRKQEEEERKKKEEEENKKKEEEEKKKKEEEEKNKQAETDKKTEEEKLTNLAKAQAEQIKKDLNDDKKDTQKDEL